ncbi:MAG TPA: pantetheine-phosphate adenylyltransferase [Bacillota bacterium]|nr:pantetheine-phosphate adenylyltransferase [Bacillota bacterium]HPF42674.1 pantetheine-phosphate adenylyltransferase [Bacillota bacterium]HPJ85420.1 pantetheine-phosphate adenylyltransferase [Bacillota bacterium]HPQ61284.1 pantetheine-phosphate adenylyltransferase [Bacillota bacterium]HRX91627.1 pantetheine-phosphate adenylyltransferase [Candidatus Izemoplasmatales bacterium]
MKVGYYPGSFDPITNGHLDIIERGAKLFDKLFVAVSINPSKRTLFTSDERFELVKEVLKNYKNIEVVKSDILTVEHCRLLGASHILRGLRAVTDYDYEFQLTNFNRKLAPDIDTAFLMTEGQYSYLSSSSVRELAEFGGDVSKFVPPIVKKAIDKKMASVSK